MTEKVIVCKIEKQDSLCQVVAYPGLQVIEVSGNGDLTAGEFEKIQRALDSGDTPVNECNRFVLLFPDVENDVAFRLVSYIKKHIYKVGFVVHPSQEKHFEPQLFHYLCIHVHPFMAHLNALSLVGRYEVKRINAVQRDDEPVDYPMITFDAARLNAPFDEGL